VLSELRITDFSSAKSLLPFHLYPVGKITWDVSERVDSMKVANALRWSFRFSFLRGKNRIAPTNLNFKRYFKRIIIVEDLAPLLSFFICLNSSCFSPTNYFFCRIINYYLIPPWDIVRNLFLESNVEFNRSTVIPRLTKIIRSGITFVSRNLR